MGKNEIKKPEKVLREDLADRKAALEADGWHFVFEGGKWEADRNDHRFGLYDALDDLLDQLEGMREIEEKHAPKLSLVLTQENRIPDDTEVSFVDEFGKEREGYVFDVSSNKTHYLIKSDDAGEVRNFYVEPSKVKVKAAAAGEPEKPKYSDRTLAVLEALRIAPDADKLPARAYDRNPEEAFSVKIPKNEKRRIAKLKEMLANAEAHLDSDIKRYDEVRNASADLIEKEGESTGDVASALMLKVNHITYTKYQINAVLELLDEPKRFESGDLPVFHYHSLSWEFASTEERQAESIGGFGDEKLPANEDVAGDGKPAEFEHFFTAKQHDFVADFNERYEVTAVAQTIAGAMQIEYLNKKEKPGKLFVLPDGNTVTTRAFNVGETISKSVLPADRYFELRSNSDGDGKTDSELTENLPTEAQAERMGELIEAGWIFSQNKEHLWSAEKEINGKKVYCGDHAYLDALFAQIAEFQPSEEDPSPEAAAVAALPHSEIKKCRFDLTDEDILLKTNALMESYRVIAQKVADFKESQKMHKKSLEKLQEEQNDLIRQIDNRVEYRPIECLLEYDLERGEVVAYRHDTQEQVDRRSMTKDELKTALAAKEKAKQRELFK